MKLSKILVLFSACTCLLASCGGDSPDIPIPPEESFEQERNEVLRNLTTSDEQYNYILNKEVNYNYSTFLKTDQTTEFLSRQQTTFNINDQDVNVDYFYYPGGSSLNHPNVGLGLLLYRAIKYKLAYPDQPNEVYITSYHYSIIAGVNLVKSSPYYGTMKSLPNEVMDRDGYVRFSYLTAFAASIGINVYVVPQLYGYSDNGPEIDIDDYYLSIVDQPCSAKHGLGDHKIGEFLHYTRCKWVSYGGKLAADMLHIKVLVTKHYLGDDDKVHDNTMFTTSANLDGVNFDGTPGMNFSQTGYIISNHEYIYNTIRNYILFLIPYCNQDDVFDFRKDFIDEIKAQKAEIKANGYANIKEKMLVYLGTAKDEIFEMQFTPLDEPFTTWSDENPYCKYVDKLLASKGAIRFYYANPKGSMNSDYLQTIFNRVKAAFKVERTQTEVNNSLLYVGDPFIASSCFDELVVGTHLGRKVINNKNNHQKDILFEYKDGGSRKSTLMFSTSNDHLGAYFYQANMNLLIKQTEGKNTVISDAFKECYEQYELKVN